MEPFDLDQTERLAALIGVPREQRDDAWRGEFFSAVPNASLASFDPQITTGPDEFSYLQLAVPDPGPLTPFSIVHVLDHVLQSGVGVVIHASVRRDENPAWVFTYGDILSYSLFQDFSGDPEVYAAEIAFLPWTSPDRRPESERPLVSVNVPQDPPEEPPGGAVEEEPPSNPEPGDEEA